MTLLSSLITEIRTNVSEPSTLTEQFFDDQELIYYIQRSINDICIDTDANFRIFRMTITGSSVGTITAASVGTDTTFTLAGHGLSDDEVVYISGITGTMASTINDNYYSVDVLTANTFFIAEDTTGLTYTAGGAVLNMIYPYTIASICGASANSILDIREIVYRAGDDQTTLYDDLPRTNLKVSLALNSANDRGNKQTCYIENDTITLTTYPQIGDILMVTGRWAPVAVALTSSTYPLGAIEEDATIKYVTAMCWLKKNKVETAAVWMTLYNERKKVIEFKKKRLTQATYPAGLSIYKQSDILNSGTIREINV